jgi:hypothetical protein
LDTAPTSYVDRGSPIPSGTEWAIGSCAAATDFGPFLSESYAWNAAINGPYYLPDVASCLHIVEEDVYFDLTFTSWTSNAAGGGFTYERSQVIEGGEMCLAGP